MSARFLPIMVCFFLFVSPAFAGYTGVPPDPETGCIVLVTGFEPFGAYTINPSQVIVQVLDGQQCDGALIYGLVLPVDFNASVELTTHAIDVLHPVLVISVGLEARSSVVHVENLAVNLKRDPFANGSDRRFSQLDPGGPLIRCTMLPTRTIVQGLRCAGIPARQSWFAGTYACNVLFYQMLGYADENDYEFEAGFVHVPLLSSQHPDGMSLEMMLEAIHLVIKTSLQEQR